MVNGPLGSVLDPRAPSRPAEVEQLSDRRLLERFTKDRDEDAFAALVQRHGPMVLGVCRRVLGNEADAQDAFQVTFLVLARKADTLEKPDLLANWIYGVAYRTAVKLRGRAARRRERERQAAAMLTPDRADPGEGREVLEVLDEELNLLPESYRILLVLCYLQGKTHEQAAHELGCPTGSMSWRLARAREMLRKRLDRRGLAFPAGALAALLLAPREAYVVALPAALAEATVKAAMSFVAGGAEAAGLSASAVSLTEEVLGTLPQQGWGRRLCALVLAAALALLTSGMLAYHVWGGEHAGGGGCHGSSAAAGPAGGTGCHP
jgi:RNA polymerase sigma factor (sigma-70 family)